jgi:hypothetical protein
MKKFMLLIRGESEWAKLSPAEMEETIKKYGAWARRLKEEGRLLDAEPLEKTGRALSGAGGVITDGPFLETKEMIGGYYIYQAADIDEAVAMGRDCPALSYGGSVEIRPIADYS